MSDLSSLVLTVSSSTALQPILVFESLFESDLNSAKQHWIATVGVAIKLKVS